jgi:hypothetical protein
MTVQERDVDDVSMARLLEEFLASRDELLERAIRARALAVPDSLATITERCLDLAGRRP